MSDENLGPMEPWQIREFPRNLRIELVQIAKDRQMSPGEFATRIFTAAKRGDWEVLEAQGAGLETTPHSELDRATAVQVMCETAAMLLEQQDRGARTAGRIILRRIALEERLGIAYHRATLAEMELNPVPRVATHAPRVATHDARRIAAPKGD